MMEDGLLAILQVAKDKRVRCQAPNCTRTVYKRIHVVRLGGAVTIYGSECFKIQFEGQAIGKSEPRFSSVTDKRLSDVERAFLDSNTELLLQRLALEHSSNLAADARLREQREPAATQWAQPKTISPHANHWVDAGLDEDYAADPVMRSLIQARRSGQTRAQMLASKGVAFGHPDFYSYSLLLAKAGFSF